MPKKSCIILIDNGSTKAAATLKLREIAQQLSQQTGQLIHPVSLQHADVIPADKLGGVKASVFVSFIKAQLQQGQRDFIVLPLFFGKSLALTRFIPDVLAELKQEFGDFNLDVADTLFPIPSMDFRLGDIIFQHIQWLAKNESLPLKNIVLVDHGSPSPQITAVRNAVAEHVQTKLGEGIRLDQAVMERRAGKAYDFNGTLLQDWLMDKAKQGETSALVAMLFSLPGRHAGEAGDIEAICHEVMQRYPAFVIRISALVGEHPLLLDILTARLKTFLK